MGFMNESVGSRVRDLGEFIREQRRQAQLSLRKLAEQAGVSNPYLSQIERGLRKPSAEILQAIAKALRISAETLYVRAGLLDPESEATDVVTAILRDRSITEGQKQTLIEIYHSFRIVASRPDESVSRGAPEARQGAGDAFGRRAGETEGGESAAARAKTSGAPTEEAIVGSSGPAASAEPGQDSAEGTADTSRDAPLLGEDLANRASA